MISKLTKLANHLDSKGLRREADYLDAIIRKIATAPGQATISADPPAVSGVDPSVTQMVLDTAVEPSALFSWIKTKMSASNPAIGNLTSLDVTIDGTSYNLPQDANLMKAMPIGKTIQVLTGGLNSPPSDYKDPCLTIDERLQRAQLLNDQAAIDTILFEKRKCISLGQYPK